MKVIIAALFSFSVLIGFGASAYAGHEISHVTTKHVQEPSDQEIDSALIAEIEDDEARSRHRHYGYGYRAYGPYYGTGYGTGDEDPNQLTAESDDKPTAAAEGYWDYGTPVRGVTF